MVTNNNHNVEQPPVTIPPNPSHAAGRTSNKEQSEQQSNQQPALQASRFLGALQAEQPGSSRQWHLQLGPQGMGSSKGMVPAQAKGSSAPKNNKVGNLE